MREIVLDTETTGFEPHEGHRIVEIGAVELFNHLPTGRTYHQYIRPDCDFEQGAAEVTGLSLEFLADKPPFEEIADAFLAFIDGAELVIHNAAFDVGFLDYELSRLGPHYGDIRARARIEDSLLLARQRFPGQRNSLDALCKRMGVDNAHRQLHGALLDAQLLAEVYLALTAGQHEIGFEAPVDSGRSVAHRVILQPTGVRPVLRVPEDDLALHAARVAAIRARAGSCLWDATDEAALPA